MKKRLLSAILSLCMLLTMAPTVAFAAKKDRPEGATGITVASGEEGTTKTSDSVWYKIDTDTKTLTIGGEGEIPDYAFENSATKLHFNQAAWYEQRNTIENVVIEEGITRVGCLAITNMQHLKSIEIKGSNVALANGAVNNYEGNQNEDKTLTITVPLSVYQKNQMEKKEWFTSSGQNRQDTAPDPTIKFKISDADEIAKNTMKPCLLMQMILLTGTRPRSVRLRLPMKNMKLFRKLLSLNFRVLLAIR